MSSRINQKLLTIGIPAFERGVRVKQTIMQARSVIESVEDQVEILVIDDNSSDDTWSLIENEGYGSVRCIRNSKRMGFKGNIRQIFLKSRSKFTMLMWDDEFMLKEGIAELVNLINKNGDVGIFSTKYLNEGRVIRGSNKLEPIKLSMVRHHTNHAPGLIFDTEQALIAISDFKYFYEHVDNWYPQVLIAYCIIFNKLRGLSLPILVCEEKTPMQSGLGNYSGVNGRWREWVFFKIFYEHLKSSDSSMAGKLIEMHDKNMFYFIYSGILSEDSASATVYLRSILRNFTWVVFRVVVGVVKSPLKYLRKKLSM